MVAETSEDFELFHYGIKGMKWGVRRPEGPDGTVRSAVKAKKREERDEKRSARKAAKQKEAEENWKKPVSGDAKVASDSRSRVKKHGTDALENKDLQKLVTRMNLEQQYTNLMESGKSNSARKAGQEYMSDILKTAGKDIATGALKWGAAEAIKYAFGRGTGGGGRSGSANVYRSNILDSTQRRIGR